MDAKFDVSLVYKVNGYPWGKPISITNIKNIKNSNSVKKIKNFIFSLTFEIENYPNGGIKKMDSLFNSFLIDNKEVQLDKNECIIDEKNFKLCYIIDEKVENDISMTFKSLSNVFEDTSNFNVKLKEFELRSIS